jgi:hypothetical protein
MEQQIEERRVPAISTPSEEAALATQLRAQIQHRQSSIAEAIRASAPKQTWYKSPLLLPVTIASGVLSLTAIVCTNLIVSNSPNAQLTRQQEASTAVAMEALRNKSNVRIRCVSWDCSGVDRLAQQYRDGSTNLQAGSLQIANQSALAPTPTPVPAVPIANPAIAIDQGWLDYWHSVAETNPQEFANALKNQGWQNPQSCLSPITCASLAEVARQRGITH